MAPPVLATFGREHILDQEQAYGRSYAANQGGYVDFLNIDFGYMSAERESVSAPRLLLDGYLDHGNLAHEALHGQRFLFLGYKGSGKSAIGERGRLLADGDAELFVTVAHLQDFPYDTLRSDVLPEGTDDVAYQSAWAWLLLLRLLGSLQADEQVLANEDAGFRRSVRALTQLGFLPARDLKALVLTSASKEFKAKLPKIAEVVVQRQYESPTLALASLVEHLKSLVRDVRTSSRHVLVIDGLDEMLIHDEAQLHSLAAMLAAVARLNEDFVRWESAVKVVVLCRTDLFDRLPGANKNKMRRDWAVVLDWYHDPRDPDASALLELANLRASIALGRPTNVIRRFFPPQIKEGEIRKVLLDHTRHTPRDLGQLLHSIQRIATANQTSVQENLSRDQIMSGLREYSIGYFLPEIRDELDGYFSATDIDRLIDVLSAARAREFYLKDLTEAASQVGASDLDLEKAIRTLFECSALGTIQSRNFNGRRSVNFTFRYRNRNSAVSMRDRFILHRGVWKALNLV